MELPRPPAAIHTSPTAPSSRATNWPSPKSPASIHRTTTTRPSISTTAPTGGRPASSRSSRLRLERRSPSSSRRSTPMAPTAPASISPRSRSPSLPTPAGISATPPPARPTRACPPAAPEERVSFLGSYIPFAKTVADRKATGDPRLSIEERYSREDYLTRYNQAIEDLIRQRWILPEDAASLKEEGAKEWDYATN